MYPHEYSDHKNVELHNVDEYADYIEEDVYGDRAKALLPSLSTIGRGPKGEGLILKVLGPKEDQFALYSTLSGKEVFRSPHMSPDKLSFEPKEISDVSTYVPGVHRQMNIVVERSNENGAIHTTDVYIPAGVQGSRIYTKQDRLLIEYDEAGKQIKTYTCDVGDLLITEINDTMSKTIPKDVPCPRPNDVIIIPFLDTKTGIKFGYCVGVIQAVTSVTKGTLKFDSNTGEYNRNIQDPVTLKTMYEIEKEIKVDDTVLFTISSTINLASSTIVWGNIIGDINDQTDLKNALDSKQPTIADLETIRSGAAKGATAAQPEDVTNAITAHNTSSNPHNGILAKKSELDSHVDNDAKHTTEAEKNNWNSKYNKPSGGIPKTDLSNSVQESLNKADSAIQEHQSLAEYRKAAEQDLIDEEKQDKIYAKKGSGSNANIFNDITTNIASGSNSTANGSGTKATATLSHTEGYQTKAASYAQHVQGKYNVIDSDSKYADIIGNGSTESARKNIEATTWTGDKRMKGNVFVNCNDDSTGGIKLVADALSNDKTYARKNGAWTEIKDIVFSFRVDELGDLYVLATRDTFDKYEFRLDEDGYLIITYKS